MKKKNNYTISSGNVFSDPESSELIHFQFKSLSKSDLPLLFEWLSLPHVAEWWRESKDWDVFSKKYSKYIDVDDVGPFIAYHQNKPIGYISWYNVINDPIRKEMYPERTYGIDLFIADPNYIGKGYGPEFIKQFIKQQLMPLHPNKIITDPEVTNVRAIHVYEKVGFKKTKIDQATDGTKMVNAQLMELDIVNGKI